MKTVKYKLIVAVGLCGTVLLWISIYGDYDLTMPNYILKQNLTGNVPNDTLMNLQNFEYIINNASICSTTKGPKDSSAVIMVHSSRGNSEQRYAIRNTWGSIKIFKKWHLHLVFLLGNDPLSSSETDAQIIKESNEHGDMIIGNFIDSYHNLTYKHLMGYKWVSSFCPSATFILKTDDDIFADIFQVVEVIFVELMTTNNTYACLNMNGNKPIRDPKSKWYVSRDVYPIDTYPAFCSGSAYLVKAKDAKKIYDVSNSTKFFWIDDVFVTGILRSKYGELANDTVSGSLNILYTMKRHHLSNKNEIIEWCKKGLLTTQLSFTFVLLTKNDFVSDMFCLWNKIRLMRYAMNAAVIEVK
ncbi:Beta-1,3-galactosyltransferase 5 [Pseudolycoriella hygida]|uniref:Hexosyltransferase n=1 Tax=Pseudolycoriella hygida TaxID=35572 RepID=A0A9Q0MXY4_9DIPT|nr:Beta-1,3-galactosyltransferase 5 [Pseudolycoriella hygida]